jgi:competence protein ComEC
VGYALWRARRNARLIVALVLLALIAVVAFFALVPPCRRHPRTLRVTVLDVGKGDAIVIESPAGRVLVVDTGGFVGRPRRRARRSGAARRRAVSAQTRHRRINVLLLTHPHADHIAGAARLLDEFEVGRVVDNGVGDKTGLVARYRNVARRKNVPVLQAARGARFDLSGGVRVVLLHPARPGEKQRAAPKTPASSRASRSAEPPFCSPATRASRPRPK